MIATPKWFRRQYIILAALLFFVSPLYATTKLMGARIATNIDHARVVFILNHTVNFHVFTIANPDRVVVDIFNTRLNYQLKGLHLQEDSPIRDIREAKRGRDDLRIVFDLKQPVRSTGFLLKADSHFKDRLVIDLVPLEAYQTAKKTNTSRSIAEKKKGHKAVRHKPVHQTKPPLKPTGRDVIVVIDPGHGGKDPGATGPRGIHEKNVVLDIAKDLQRLLNKTPGIHADLTRKGDYYLTLRQRLQIARKDKSDLFIAIHADAYKNKTAKGASVFALSQRGATSEAARWLAERENYSELGGVKHFSDKSYLVRSVLLDLSQTVTITQSLQMGNVILNSLRRITPLHSNCVEQARFVVLKSPDIPSLLIESGFITNKYEERLLNSRSYQEKLARALDRGILDYFRAHPPRGTLFAAKKRSHHYIVKRGDTLTGIAMHYDVSVANLRRFNRLRSDAIDVGQALRIPPSQTG